MQLPPITLPTRPAPPQQALAPSQRILTYFCDQPITGDMNCTTALSGATFIQPAIIEYQGQKALVFPFSVRSDVSPPRYYGVTVADDGS